MSEVGSSGWCWLAVMSVAVVGGAIADARVLRRVGVQLQMLGW